MTSSSRPRRVVLDTDIGSDVDDALALAVLLGSSEVDLLGCTTVYGDTPLRARLAARLMRLAGRRAPVVPGERETLAGRPVWWAGHEGARFGDLAGEAVDDGVSGPEFLAGQVAAAPGRVDVVAIGPLTNVSRAIQLDPAFPRRVRHLWVMGGRFGGGRPEHNLSSDPEAAAVVFGSRTPVTVTGLEITTTARLEAGHLSDIEAGGELGGALAAEIRGYWRFRNTEWNHPHDPMAVLSMLAPELFTFSPYGRVSVGEDGAVAFARGEGSARITTAADAARVVAEIVRRIAAAATARR